MSRNCWQKIGGPFQKGAVGSDAPHRFHAGSATLSAAHFYLATDSYGSRAETGRKRGKRWWQQKADPLSMGITLPILLVILIFYILVFVRKRPAQRAGGGYYIHRGFHVGKRSLPGRIRISQLFRSFGERKQFFTEL